MSDVAWALIEPNFRKISFIRRQDAGEASAQQDESERRALMVILLPREAGLR